MKNGLLLLAGIAAIAIGYRMVYSVGYSAGHSQGYIESAARANVPEKHHYEFKQNGSSIFRLDSETGESCWIQLSEADGRIEDHLTYPMQQCSQ
jgi:hypothetical protein